MNDVWFTNTEPVRGICVASWICDQAGQVIEGFERDQEAFTRRSYDIQSESNVETFRNVERNRRSSTIANNQVVDTEMIGRLNQLIRDARDAFGTVLARNADLEREIDASRVLTATPSHGGPTPRSSSLSQTMGLTGRSSAPVIPLLSLPTRQQRSFDISTPPTYKENASLFHRQLFAAGSSKIRRPSSDSGSIRRGISVYNS
jgi:hypothetical protein